MAWIPAFLAVSIGSASLAPRGVAGDDVQSARAQGERFVLDMADERTGKCVAEPLTDRVFRIECGERSHGREDLSPYLNLPMRVGKSCVHHYHEPVGGSERVIEARVTKRETATVPAGTYEAYRLELLDRPVDRERGLRETCWYAPSIRFPVRCRGAITSAFELIRHRGAEDGRRPSE